MNDRRMQELELITAHYGKVEVGPNLDWVLIKRLPLVPGWNKGETSVLVLVPAGYPVTPPDNFYVDNDLRLAGGQIPGNTTPNQAVLGRAWMQFSYHVEGSDWRPHADMLQGHNLMTFLAGVLWRLAEAN